MATTVILTSTGYTSGPNVGGKPIKYWADSISLVSYKGQDNVFYLVKGTTELYILDTERSSWSMANTQLIEPPDFLMGKYLYFNEQTSLSVNPAFQQFATVSSNQPLVVTNNTGSTSTDTGSIIADGGLGVAENVYVGGKVVIEASDGLHLAKLATTDPVTLSIASSSTTGVHSITSEPGNILKINTFNATGVERNIASIVGGSNTTPLVIDITVPVEIKNATTSNTPGDATGALVVDGDIVSGSGFGNMKGVAWKIRTTPVTNPEEGDIWVE